MSDKRKNLQMGTRQSVFWSPSPAAITANIHYHCIQASRKKLLRIAGQRWERPAVFTLLNQDQGTGSMCEASETRVKGVKEGFVVDEARILNLTIMAWAPEMTSERRLIRALDLILKVQGTHRQSALHNSTALRRRKYTTVVYSNYENFIGYS